MGAMNRQPYLTDLTDAEWSHLEPHMPAPHAGGRPRLHSVRDILNAIFYILRSGCAWRLLPHDLPPWKTVYHYFRLWRLQGLWDTIHKVLHVAVRVKARRNPQPSAAIIDSQSVKTTMVGGPRGYDGGKKVNGRKRHLLVDTQGLIIRAVVHRADITDRDGAKWLLGPMPGQLPRLQHLWADSAYTGQVRQWIEATLGCTVEIVKHWWTGLRWVWVGPGQEPPTIPAGFHVLPRRWVVERTFAWLVTNRRLSKDYEKFPETSEALIYLAMSRLMVKRLAH
jgi:putative transposase